MVQVVFEDQHLACIVKPQGASVQVRLLCSVVLPTASSQVQTQACRVAIWEMLQCLPVQASTFCMPVALVGASMRST